MRLPYCFLALSFCSGFSVAAEIYQCKTSQGGLFWTSGNCQASGGYLVDIAQVPAGMSFQDQVRLAEQARGQSSTARAVEDQGQARARECASIDFELRQIHGRYANGQFVPVERVGPDQVRVGELNSQRSRLSCQTR